MPTGNPKIDPIKFNHLFYIEKLSLKEIASFFNVGISAIGSFRRRHKLKGRGWSKPPWLGKSRSKEDRKKISNGRKGKMKGVDNPSWKGGKYISYSGYIRILHPKHSGYKGYCLEHRCLMENFLGRKLNKNEIVHHKNGIKTDNRIENLCLYNRSSHGKKHYPKGSKFGIHKYQE